MPVLQTNCKSALAFRDMLAPLSLFGQPSSFPRVKKTNAFACSAKWNYVSVYSMKEVWSVVWCFSYIFMMLGQGSCHPIIVRLYSWRSYNILSAGDTLSTSLT